MIAENIQQFKASIPENVTLIAVSKTKPVDAIEEAYAVGQRDFGENKVQELTDKSEVLPKDIRWHMIGHLQTNKVKYIAPFVHLIHSLDSEKLAKEINKRAKQNDRVISCLVQVHVGDEATKFGFSPDEARAFIQSIPEKGYENIAIAGLMGMATNTEDEQVIHDEFKALKNLFDELKGDSKYNLDSTHFQTLSMGMSGDYQIAIEEGSNMIRIGSSLFGARNYSI
tara:strand:- start:163 stop:840 length:678 start_codon:yes stop_codon:yes gene_type:complete